MEIANKLLNQRGHHSEGRSNHCENVAGQEMAPSPKISENEI